MYQSQFLLNRQKITSPIDIYPAIAGYFSHLRADRRGKIFYRLEWYRIGIVVPLLVYSDSLPLMQRLPACQLTTTADLPDLPKSADQLEFSLFAVPDSRHKDTADESAAVRWLQKQLGSSAILTDTKIGPNNCLYFSIDGDERQQQTVTIKGTMQVCDRAGLEKIRRHPLGDCIELGCGLLMFNEP